MRKREGEKKNKREKNKKTKREKNKKTKTKKRVSSAHHQLIMIETKTDSRNGL